MGRAAAVGALFVTELPAGQGGAFGEADQAETAAGDGDVDPGVTGLVTSMVRPEPGAPRTTRRTGCPGACLRALVRASWTIR